MRRSYALLNWLYGTAFAVAIIAELRAAGGSDRIAPIVSVCGVLVYVAVMAWTWVNLDNIRRVLARSRRRKGVSPWRGVFWWMSPIVLGLPLVLLAHYGYDEYFRSPDFIDRDTELIGGLLVGLAYVTLLVLWLRPYFYLGKVIKRIHGDASRFTRWLWMPVAIGLLMVMATIFLIPLLDLVVVDLVAIVMPMSVFALWAWLGWSAMTGMEYVIRQGHDRLLRERAHHLEALRAEEARRVAEGG